MSTKALREYLGDRITERVDERLLSGLAPKPAAPQLDESRIVWDDPTPTPTSTQELDESRIEWDDEPSTSLMDKAGDMWQGLMDRGERTKKELYGEEGVRPLLTPSETAQAFKDKFKEANKSYNEMESWNPAKAIWELPVAMGSAALTTAAAGIAGLASLPKGVSKATDVIEEISSYGYSPTGKLSKTAMDAIGSAMEWWMSLKDKADHEVLDYVTSQVDAMIEKGELKPEARKGMIDSIYSPIYKAFETGVWNFVPEMVLRVTGKGGKGTQLAKSPVEGEFIPGSRGQQGPVAPGGREFEGQVVPEEPLMLEYLQQDRLERQAREGDVLPPQEGISQDRARLGVDPVEGEVFRPDLIGEQGKLPGPRQESLPYQPQRRIEAEPPTPVPNQLQPTLSPPEMIRAEIERLSKPKQPESKMEPAPITKPEPTVAKKETVPEPKKVEKPKEIGESPRKGHDIINNDTGKVIGKVTRQERQNSGNKIIHFERPDGKTDSLIYFKDEGNSMHTFVKPDSKPKRSTLKTVKKELDTLYEKGGISSAKTKFDEIMASDRSASFKKQTATHYRGLKKLDESLPPKTMVKETPKPRKVSDSDPITQIQRGLDKGKGIITIRSGGKDIALHRFEADKAMKKNPKTPKALYNALGRTGSKSAAMELLAHSDIKKVYGGSRGGIIPYMYEGKINIAGKDLEIGSSFDIKGKKKWSIIDPDSGQSVGALDEHTKKNAIDTATAKLERYSKNNNLDELYEKAAKRTKEDFMYGRDEDFNFQKEAGKHVKGDSRLRHSNTILEALEDRRGFNQDRLKKVKEASARLSEMGVPKGDVLNLQRKSKYSADMNNRQRSLFKDAVEEGYKKKAPTRKGGLGGKQGGELNLEPFVDGINMAKSALKATVYGPMSAAATIARYGMRAPAEVIRGLGTPEAYQLADILSKPQINTTTRPVKPDLYERYQVVSGRFRNELDGYLEPLRGRMGNIGKTNNDLLLKQLLSDKNLPVVWSQSPRLPRNMPEPNAEIMQAAREVRTVLNKTYRYVTSQGIKIADRMKYFPRVWDVEKILNRAGLPDGSFVDFLMEDARVDGKRVDRDMAQRITQNIIDNDGILDDNGFGYKDKLFLLNDTPSPTSSHFMARKIEIDDKIAMEWMETNVEAVLTKFVDAMALRGEYARSFGAHGEKLDKMIKKIEKDYNKNRTGRMKVKEIEPFIHDLSNAILNRKGSIENAYISKTVRAMTNLQVITKLPLVALTSLSELGLVTGVGGRHTPKAFLRVVENTVNESAAKASRLITGKRRIPKKELQESLERLGIVTINALEHAQNTRFTGKTGKISAKMMRWNLHDQLTNFQRSLAQQVAMEIVKSNSAKLAKEFDRIGSNDRTQLSRAGKDYHAQLIEMGIDPDNAVRWYRDGMTDRTFENFAAINSVGFVNRLIQKPNPTRTPTWMFSEQLSWFYTFKKFAFTFHNNYLDKMIKNAKHKHSFTGKTAYMAGGLLATAIAYMTMKIKDQAYYGGSEENPFRGDDRGKMIMEAIDRSGFTGYMTYPMSVIQPRYGFWDSSAKRMINLAGPAFTDIAQVVDVMTAEDKAKEFSKFATKNIPSPFYIGAGMLQGKGASEVKKKAAKDLAKALGSKGKKRSSSSRSRSRGR